MERQKGPPHKGRLTDSALAKERVPSLVVPAPAAGQRDRYHDRWIDQILTTRKYRASSLLLTVLGDSVAPHGGVFWLSDLISLMESMGINERLVRTAVFRLSKDGWLESTQVGRQSYYELTQEAFEGFDDAFDRVYSLDDRSGVNNWCMVVMGDMTQVDRKKALREFAKAGFARLSPGTYIHPTIDFHSADLQLTKLGIRDKCLLMRAGLHQLNPPDLVSDYLTQWWNLEDIEQDYHAFRETFEPLYQNLKRTKSLNGERAFIIRTILIHEYRQLTIASPQLPTDLLGKSWGGAKIRDLVSQLYRHLHQSASDYVDRVLTDTGAEQSEDRLRDEKVKYLSRFGGLV